MQLSGSGTPGGVRSGPGGGRPGRGAWKERHTQKLDRDSCETRNLGQVKTMYQVSHSSAQAIP